MSIQLTGTIQRTPLGLGAWVLQTAEGQYELAADPPAALLQAGLQVTVNGIIREDLMTLAMVGPVLEVQSFEPQA